MSTVFEYKLTRSQIQIIVYIVNRLSEKILLIDSCFDRLYRKIFSRGPINMLRVHTEHTHFHLKHSITVFLARVTCVNHTIFC